MTANRDLERRISDFYAAEAPPRAPDWVLRSALATVDTTQQRRPLIWLPRRFSGMNGYARLAIAAVVAIAVGVIGLAILRPGGTPSVGVGGPPRSPSPSPLISTSPSAPASPLPPLSQTFDSSIHGMSVSYPAGWKVRAATTPWVGAIPMFSDTSADVVYDGSDTDPTFVGLSSQPLGRESADDWITKIINDPKWEDTCSPGNEPVMIDGTAGRFITHCPDDGFFTAHTTKSGRGFLFVFYKLGDRAWADGFLATVKLHPEDAVGSSPPASP